jgi:hypothetical protein
VHLVINRQFCEGSFFSRGNRFLSFETFDIKNLSDKFNSHDQGVQNLSNKFFVTIIFQKLKRFYFEWSNLGNGTKKRFIIYGIFFCQNCQKLEKSLFSPKICQKNGLGKEGHSNFLATFFGKSVPVFHVALLCFASLRLKKTFKQDLRETDLFKLKFLFIYSQSTNC